MNAVNLPGFTAEASLRPRNSNRSFRNPSSGWSAMPSAGLVEPQRCGVIAGSAMEDRFSGCMIQCRSAGGTQSGCWSACCRQLTGYSCCYIA